MCRYKADSMKRFHKYLAIFTLSFLLIAFSLGKIVKDEKANAKILSPLPAPILSEPEVTIIPTPTPTPFPNLTIKEYIYTIFGNKNGKIACAISMSESGMQPDRINSWEKEHSVGIFQINLMSKYAKIHWSKVPGSTLEEKQKWLSDPYNNTLIAYKIFNDSGWTPWTAYKTIGIDGSIYESYLSFMEVCGL